jgi:hypothetical protein
MQMHNLVKEALKAKAPALHKSLQATGKLNEYAIDVAHQINSEIVSMTMEDHRRGKWGQLEPMERVGRMNQATALNREKVLAEMLEFPQDETPRESWGSLLNRKMQDWRAAGMNCEEWIAAEEKLRDEFDKSVDWPVMPVREG